MFLKLRLKVTAVHSASGQIISDPVAVRERWAEYFEQLYQVDPPTVNLDAGSAVISLPDPSISEDLPSVIEVRGAISKLKSGKAVGICSITAELLKAGGEPVVQGLHAVLAATRRSDRILALNITVERRGEFGLGLLAAYIDLKKAFDTARRESLWEIRRLREIPTRIIGLIASLYIGADSTVTDYDFAVDFAIISDSLETLVVVLDAISNEAKPLGLDVSWIKTKVQDFGNLLREPVWLVRACGEDIEVTESFTYLDSVVHNSGLSDQEVSRWIGLVTGVMNSLNKSFWRCRYLCRRTKLQVFKALIMPILLYGSETWTLSSLVLRPFVIGPCAGSWGIVDRTMCPTNG
ncbi:uncharacterized protein [Penaeus vannamei]|uniref:uncharacterized protein n=1 Tax=Penaeus vannamei TaxID=6689 RepID=UPI00387F3FEB